MADRRGQQFGNYRLVRLLGQGGAAEVYLGEHVEIAKRVAIKVLHDHITDEDIKVNFCTEARLIAILAHPHIIPILDFGVEQTTPYLIMEYAPNGSLRQRHPRDTRLSMEQITDYITQIASALQYAHNYRIAHCDLKPENILLGHDNHLLLSDFGLAHIIQSTRFQHTDHIAGTPTYMAPEQFQGRPRIESDQYAMGILVYEWLCGSPPFQGDFFGLMYKHLYEAPPSLQGRVSDILSTAEGVVLKALEKDPKQRYERFQDFANALIQAFQVEQNQRFAPTFGTIPAPAVLPPGEPGPPDPEITRDAGASESDQSTLQRAPSSGPIFLFNEQLTKPSDLYGRVYERETLLDRSRRGASTSIVGPRRIGKTWLMSYVRLIMPTLPGSHVRTGYLDATSPQSATIEGFVNKALKELDVPFIRSEAALLGLTLLERVVQDLKSQHQLALLCIDEFEGFGKRDEFTVDFFENLRAIAQQGLGLVVASRSSLIEIVGHIGKTSPFFNIFEELPLEPFSTEEAQEFAYDKSIQARFTEQERDYLLKYGRVGDGQWPPVRLQLVGSMLLQHKRSGPKYYRPDDPDYWRKFEQQLERKFRGVIG